MNAYRRFKMLMTLRTLSEPCGKTRHTASTAYRIPANKIGAYTATVDAMHYDTRRCTTMQCGDNDSNDGDDYDDDDDDDDDDVDDDDDDI